MICVKIYWNTDADGIDVPDDVDLEDGPISYYGPFTSMSRAVSWMNNDFPEDDEDVHEMVAGEFDLEKGVYINTPESIFGDVPDVDIRDYEDVPGG